MTEIHSRQGRPDDAERLAVLARQTFVDTFVEGFGIPYPEADLKAFLDKSFSVATTREDLEHPDRTWFVAEREGELLGFATVGGCALPHPEARPEHAELKRLYVSRAAQGLGVGTRLLALAMEAMDTRWGGPQWIGVWSGNLKAQKLYGAHGFQKAGEYDYPVGSWLDREFILRKG